MITNWNANANKGSKWPNSFLNSWMDVVHIGQTLRLTCPDNKTFTLLCMLVQPRKSAAGPSLEISH